VSDFEESLEALDARLEEIQRRGKAGVSAIVRARAAARLGRTNDIAKALDDISKRLSEASEAADGLADCWQFDTSAYLADGRFLDDLKAAAAETGLNLFEHDGRIYCFPLLVRVDPKANAVKIGRKIERRIRPSAFANHSFSSFYIGPGGDWPALTGATPGSGRQCCSPTSTTR
jgi:hypothetical protein